MRQTFNGYPIIKLEAPEADYNGILSHYESLSVERVRSLVDSLECGYYAIKGNEFQILEKKWSGRKDIIFPLGNSEQNYINKYITFKLNNQYKNELAMGLRVEYEDDYEPTCMSCGDGGCIHCTPSWFI